MTTHEARTSKLLRSLAVAQASITILSLVSLSFPAAAFATTTPTANLEVKKVLVGAPEGVHPDNFSFTYDKQGNDPAVIQQFEADGQNDLSVQPGAYDIGEVSVPGYTVSYSSNQQGHANDCNNLSAGNDQDVQKHGPVICTITNTYTPPQTCTFVSDSSTQVDGHDSVVITRNPAWALIDSISWIWGDVLTDSQASTGSNQTFTKNFSTTGIGTAGLDLASDNGYVITLDGNPVDDKSTLETAYNPTHHYDFPNLPSGNHTLAITVYNFAGGNASSNPAGLTYKLTVTAPTCGDTAHQGPTTGHVKIIKHVINDGGGSLVASNFSLHVKTAGEAGVDVSGSPANGSETGTDYTLPAGDYQVSEDANASYTTTYSETCADGHLHVTAGGDMSCTVINTYKPPVNSCVAPSTTGGPAHIVLGSSWVPSEKSMQQILTDAGYSTNADTAQVNTQTWNGSGNTVDFSVKALSKNAQDSHVFGYILNDGSFVGVFRDGPISTTTYASLPLKTMAADGDVPFTVAGVTTVQFGIWDEATGKLYSTKKGTNSDGLDHGVVYNPLTNEYVIGFEDVLNGGDKDMNDLVVTLNVTGCHDANTTATVIATKIVCDNESDLPNLAGSSHETSSTTAATFLASHPACHLEPNWQFEWGNQDAGDTADTFTGPAGNGYTTSSFTNASGTVSMSIPLQGLSSIHMREVLKPGYIGFTHGAHPDNSDTVSAELACSTDGLNYDNWDFINNPVAGETYYCVAYNAKAKSDVTLCKLDDQQKPLSGWNLFLKGTHVEDVVVPTNTSAGVNSVNPLVAGASYLALATGTWTNQGGANPVDAEYSTTDGWATHMNGYTGYGDGILETEINQTDGEWGPYNSGHSYAQSFVATSTNPANFRIFDGDTGTHIQNEGWFGDNTGRLAVGLYQGYAGMTGENGCVTFKNVPYGTYTVGETPQDGWTNVSGAGEVTVDAPTKTFTVVNHLSQCVLVSNTTTYQGGTTSVLSSYIHSDWTAAIAGASWIWGEDHTLADTSANASTETFTKTFTLATLPTSGSLEIATDNSYNVTVNGNPVGADAGEFNYTSGGQDTITVPVSDLVIGENTLVITVNNMPLQSPNDVWQNNPAGLLYKLTLTGADCTETTPEPTFLKVHIYKYLWNNQEEAATQVPDNFEGPQFPMVASWNAANIGAGSGNYVLGNQHGGATFKWAADTTDMQAPADYETHEVTGGDSVVVASREACSPGKYYLVGYKSGSSLEDAESASLTETAPAYTDITSDRSVIVVNAACPEDNGGEETTHTDETIVIKAADLAAGFPDVLSDVSKWFFYNDNTDTINDALGSFVTGPATAPAGTGSAQITLDATNTRTDIATYAFKNSKLADITTLGFSAYSHSGVAGPNESPYLVFNVSFNGVDSWQKRLVYVPSANGAVPQDGWNTYDALNGGSALWTWSGYAGNGNKWPDNNTSEYRTWNDIKAAFPLAQLRSSDSFMGVRVGEPGPTGYTGNIDKFVIGIKTGSNIDTKTFDFEPTAVVPTITTTSEGGHSHGSSLRGTGKVLGESTTTSPLCSPILTTYLKKGLKNDVDQVKKLQQFLNNYLGLHLAVTGFFGPATYNAVKLFQKTQWDKVLKPWFGLPGSGIQSQNTPTGYVYKTTKWHINNIVCPGSEDFPSNLD